MKTNRLKHICLLTLITSLFLTSCIKKETPVSPSFQVVDIDTRKLTEIKVSDFVDSITFIPLETLNESLIGEVTQVEFYNNELIIHDYKTNAILVFDKTGKYKHHISKIGQGPGEYIDIGRFAIKNNNIYILDPQRHKILIHSVEGSYINEISLDQDNIYFFDFLPLDDDNFLCIYPEYNKYLNKNLWIMDSGGKTLKIIDNSNNMELLSSRDKYTSMLYSIDKDIISINNALLNTIYHYNVNTNYLEKKIEFKPNNKISLVKAFEQGVTRKENSNILSQAFSCERNNFILTKWGYSQFDKRFDIEIIQPIYTLYNKQESSIKIAEDITFDNVANFISYPCDFINSKKENAIIGVITSQAIEYTQNDKLAEGKRATKLSKEMMDKLIKKTHEGNIEDMNPILEIFHIKK